MLGLFFFSVLVGVGLVVRAVVKDYNAGLSMLYDADTASLRYMNPTEAGFSAALVGFVSVPWMFYRMYGIGGVLCSTALVLASCVSTYYFAGALFLLRG